MPRDGAIIFADLIGKLDAPYKSGPSKTWLKIKNPKASAAPLGAFFKTLLVRGTQVAAPHAARCTLESCGVGTDVFEYE